MSFTHLKKSIIDELESRLQKNSIEHLKVRPGLRTGVQVIDDYLHWRGLPVGDVALFTGTQLDQSIQLWMQSSTQIANSTRKAAWVKVGIQSSTIKQKNVFQFTICEQANNFSDYFFSNLSELIESKNFDLIGVHTAHQSLCLQHLQHLKELCKKNQVTLVFVTQSMHLKMQPVFPLVIECENDFYTIQKAEHRPTPMVISGNMIENDFTESIRSSFIRYVC